MSETRFFYLNMVLTTFDTQNSRTFQEQITVFKDKDLFNKLSFFDPLLNSYWLKHSVESLTISLHDEPQAVKFLSRNLIS